MLCSVDQVLPMDLPLIREEPITRLGTKGSNALRDTLWAVTNRHTFEYTRHKEQFLIRSLRKVTSASAGINAIPAVTSAARSSVVSGAQSSNIETTGPAESSGTNTAQPEDSRSQKRRILDTHTSESKKLRVALPPVVKSPQKPIGRIHIKCPFKALEVVRPVAASNKPKIRNIQHVSSLREGMRRPNLTEEQRAEMLAYHRAELEDETLYNEWTDKWLKQKVLYEAEIMRWETLRTRANYLERALFDVDEWNSVASSADEEEEAKETEAMKIRLQDATCSSSDPHLDTVYTKSEIDAARISAERWYQGEKRMIETQTDPKVTHSKLTNTLPYIRGTVTHAVTYVTRLHKAMQTEPTAEHPTKKNMYTQINTREPRPPVEMKSRR